MKNQQTVQYALMCLQALEEMAGQSGSSVELSRRCGVPLSDCAPLLRRLSSANLIETEASGNYLLRQPLSELTALDVLTALAVPVLAATPFKMRVGPDRGLVMRKTLEAVAWSRSVGVYPSENGPVLA